MLPVTSGNPVDKQESYQTIKTLYTHCIEVLNTHKLTNQVFYSVRGVVIMLYPVVCQGHYWEVVYRGEYEITC